MRHFEIKTEKRKVRKRCQHIENNILKSQDRIGYAGVNIRPKIAIGLT